MAFSIRYWANYTQGKTKLSRKSENAVADDRVLKSLCDADLSHVESSVRCHQKYKNGYIKAWAPPGFSAGGGKHRGAECRRAAGAERGGVCRRRVFGIFQGQEPPLVERK